MSSSFNQTMPNLESALHIPVGNLINDISLWVQIIGSEGQVVFTNRFAERLSGYSAQEFANGNLLWEVLFADKPKGLRLKNICLNILKDSRGFSNKMIEIVTRAGDKKWLLFSMDTLAHDNSSDPDAILIGLDYSVATRFL